MPFLQVASLGSQEARVTHLRALLMPAFPAPVPRPPQAVGSIRHHLPRCAVSLIPCTASCHFFPPTCSPQSTMCLEHRRLSLVVCLMSIAANSPPEQKWALSHARRKFKTAQQSGTLMGIEILVQGAVVLCAEGLRGVQTPTGQRPYQRLGAGMPPVSQRSLSSADLGALGGALPLGAATAGGAPAPAPLDLAGQTSAGQCSTRPYQPLRPHEGPLGGPG